MAAEAKVGLAKVHSSMIGNYASYLGDLSGIAGVHMIYGIFLGAYV
jgi:hypothetical protein